MLGELAGMDNSQGSAFSRCPVEIWLHILDLATRASLPKGYLEGGCKTHSIQRMVPAQIRWNGILNDVEDSYASRAEAVGALTNLTLVCRAWRDVVQRRLYEWVTISGNRRLTAAVALLKGKPISGHRRGSEVRRLEFVRTSMDAWTLCANEVVRIVEMCDNLEEIVCQHDVNPGLLISALLKACFSSLRHIYFGSGFYPTLKQLKSLATNCPQLETLHVMSKVPPRSAAPEHYDQWPPGLELPSPRPIATLPLRSLAIRLPEIRDTFLGWIAEFNLPYLRHFAITTEERIRTPDVLSQGLKAFLAAHSDSIRSLEIIEECDPLHAVGSLAWTVLDLCPNVTDFIFDLSGTGIESPSRTHHALRRVGCHSFFLDNERFINDGTQSQRRLQAHIENVLNTIISFCDPDFPNLRVIRCLDVQPQTSQTRERVNPDEYRQLASQAVNLCSANGLRFEDALGQFVRMDFAPRSSAPTWR